MIFVCFYYRDIYSEVCCTYMRTYLSTPMEIAATGTNSQFQIDNAGVASTKHRQAIRETLAQRRESIVAWIILMIVRRS